MSKDNQRQAAQGALQDILGGAIAHIQAGRLDEAVALLQSSGGAALKNPVGRNIMGDIRLDDALAAEDRALALRPGYATAHFNRGNVLRDLGRMDEAIAAYSRTLAAQPAYPEALVNRGMVLIGRGMAVETLGEELAANPDGFREMAAVMANLDLMIVSDSAPAHLAGALGRPVWVALPRHPDWRWLTERADSPWYPTMRLFRQKSAGDWPGVFAAIAAALDEAVGHKVQP